MTNQLTDQRLSPVLSADRETFMDVLRGFAILGIFLANLGTGFSWYSEDAHLSGPLLLPYWDHKIKFLHAMFIEGKFYSIFSLLFGWGIALQVKRGIAKGTDAVPTIRRRLLFMLLLGAFHLMLWPGDIVFFYALLGFILLPFRKFSDKTLLITGGTFILLPILLYAAKMQWPVLNAPAGLLFDTGKQLDHSINHIDSDADFRNLLKNGDWWEIFKGNIVGFFGRYGYLFFVSRIPKVLGMFLIGYVVGRSDFYKKTDQYKTLLRGIIAFGILVGLPANYFLAKYIMHHEMDYFLLTANGLYQTIFYALGVVPLAMTYVALMMLAFQTSVGKKILTKLAPVGKMAFSNYILQTLIGNFVFLGAGLGLMGQVGPVCYTVFGLIVFLFQIVISTIWLRYFNFGPLEWLWRSGTYGKWQTLKKR